MSIPLAARSLNGRQSRGVTMRSGLVKDALVGVFGAVALTCVGQAVAESVPGQGTWERTLQSRDLDGDHVADAYFDTLLKITWLREANWNGAGGLNWSNANGWASSLNIGGYGGWRLPTLLDSGMPGCDFGSVGTDCGYNVQTKIGSTVYSEMAHLFYETLGNRAAFDESGNSQTGSGLSNTGNFLNFHSYYYWTDVKYMLDVGSAWFFSTTDGFQGVANGANQIYALAVHAGDIGSPVPEPQTMLLMLAGLGLLTVRYNLSRVKAIQ